MGYREFAPPALLRDVVECGWTSDDRGTVSVLPDGCMDLIRMDGRVVVAGPDTSAVVTGGGARSSGLRFRPGALPALIGVPAFELTGQRVPLADLCAVPRSPRGLVALTLALADSAPGRAPWPLATLHHVTSSLAAGAAVDGLAADVGWSSRTLLRQCRTSYGYGPATLRRILRFRRAVRLLRSERSIGDVAAVSGYADQAHLTREIREFAATSPAALVAAHSSRAKRSTEVPSGSVTVA